MDITAFVLLVSLFWNIFITIKSYIKILYKTSRRIGKTFIPHETAGWFPEEALRDHYGIAKNREPTKIEKTLFGFRDDGREGLVVPTFPRIETKLSMIGGSDPETASIKYGNTLEPPSSQPVFSIDTIQDDP